MKLVDPDGNKIKASDMYSRQQVKKIPKASFWKIKSFYISR